MTLMQLCKLFQRFITILNSHAQTDVFTADVRLDGLDHLHSDLEFQLVDGEFNLMVYDLHGCFIRIVSEFQEPSQAKQLPARDDVELCAESFSNEIMQTMNLPGNLDVSGERQTKI